MPFAACLRGSWGRLNRTHHGAASATALATLEAPKFSSQRGRAGSSISPGTPCVRGCLRFPLPARTRVSPSAGRRCSRHSEHWSSSVAIRAWKAWGGLWPPTCPCGQARRLSSWVCAVGSVPKSSAGGVPGLPPAWPAAAPRALHHGRTKARRFVLVSGAVLAERELEVKTQLSYFVTLQGNQNCTMFVKNLKLDTSAMTAVHGAPGTRQPRRAGAGCASSRPPAAGANCWASLQAPAHLYLETPSVPSRAGLRDSRCPAWGSPGLWSGSQHFPGTPQLEGHVFGGRPGDPLGAPYVPPDTRVPVGVRPSLPVAPGRHE